MAAFWGGNDLKSKMAKMGAASESALQLTMEDAYWPVRVLRVDLSSPSQGVPKMCDPLWR
jgi:hypothetical protein